MFSIVYNILQPNFAILLSLGCFQAVVIFFPISIFFKISCKRLTVHCGDYFQNCNANVTFLFRFELALQQNEIMDVFYDDYLSLADEDSTFGSKSDNYLKVGLLE